MTAVDLLFRAVPSSTSPPIDLRFGEVATPVNADASIDATLPALEVDVAVAQLFEASIDAALPDLEVDANIDYSSATARPLVGKTDAYWQVATPAETGSESLHAHTEPTPSGSESVWQSAIRLDTGIEARQAGRLLRTRGTTRVVHQDAMHLGTRAQRLVHQDGLRDRRTSTTSRFQEAVRLREQHTRGVWQDCLRDRRQQRTAKWQSATSLQRSYESAFNKAKRSVVGYAPRYQEAIVPPPGLHIEVPVTPFDPCYLPDTNLLFADNYAVTKNLVFYCERHPPTPPIGTITVPIRSVYVVINDLSLIRVSDGLALPALGVSMSIDIDSWTWGFSASLPGSSLADVQATIDGPVELEANINGNHYRVLVEKIARDRSFNSSIIKISGRGKSALLSSPYSPVLTFANSIQRTAQQLMADVLTFNGIPIGWDIDWQIEDWLVSAGAFNERGSYIDGLLSIAGAAGAYLQPHPVDQTMSVLLKYPVAPWEWGIVDPDFILPSAVTVTEGIEWLEKPEYNRVYVSGTSHGVIGRVTRSGSAGDLVAPMVADPLITAVEAARQRGISILADTGRQAMVSLRLPVLSETGVITPGKWVRYTDGAETRFGIVRSTNVGAGLPETFQSIQVETHL